MSVYPLNRSRPRNGCTLELTCRAATCNHKGMSISSAQRTARERHLALMEVHKLRESLAMAQTSLRGVLAALAVEMQRVPADMHEAVRVAVVEAADAVLKAEYAAWQEG